MDINQVKIGNYSVSNSYGNGVKKESEKAQEQEVQQQSVPTQSAKAEDVLSAMNLSALVNQAYVKKADAKEVNPADYLSEERISDIEAMMAEFDNGVNGIAEMISGEFGDTLSNAKVNELAAKIYAGE